MYNSPNKIVSTFFEKKKYRIMSKGLLTFLGRDYRVASLVTFYFVVLEINISKIR